MKSKHFLFFNFILIQSSIKIVWKMIVASKLSEPVDIQLLSGCSVTWHWRLWTLWWYSEQGGSMSLHIHLTLEIFPPYTSCSSSQTEKPSPNLKTLPFKSQRIITISFYLSQHGLKLKITQTKALPRTQERHALRECSCVVSTSIEREGFF